jgi:hypothetical protein
MLIPKGLLARLVSLELLFIGGFAAVTSAQGRNCGDGVGPCSCGDTVVANTTLDASDPVTSAVCPCDGLVVDGVTFDLGGHTLRGSGQCSGVTVLTSANPDPPATVTNGHIVNYSIGLDVRNEHHHFASLNITGNDTGVEVRGGRNLLEKSTVHGNRGVGIHLGSDSNTVRNVAITRNGEQGIVVGGRGFHLVERSTVTGNTSDGIDVFGDSSRIRDNVVRDNGGHGVLVRASFRGEVIGNVITGNGGHGLDLVGNGFTIDHNRITANDENGMRIGGHGHMVTKNITSGNGGDSPEFHGLLNDAFDSHVTGHRSERNAGFGIKATGAGNAYDANVCSGNGLGDSDPPGLCR